jgi:AraC family transcriptional regulator, positive regulator of tynA and feaB
MPPQAVLAFSANELVESAIHSRKLNSTIDARAEAGMVSWSTEAINERERFSYWREMICNTLFSISPEAPSERFSARLKVRNCGPLRFATCESTSYEIIRTRRDIARAPADHYTIYLQLRGETVINQGGETVAFRRNDIVLSDCRHPFRAVLSNDGRRAVAVLPRAMVNSRAPWLCQRPLHRIPDSRFLDLARRHMLRLVSDDLSENETNLLTENLCNLLALASVADIPANRLQSELQLEALLTFCRQNLYHPKLTPQFAAQHFDISVRTLHLRFKKFGQTFGKWLLEARLDASCKALRDSKQQARSISEIAYCCGFNDLSHFNKTFRARFGVTPSQCRHELVPELLLFNLPAGRNIPPRA